MFHTPAVESSTKLDSMQHRLAEQEQALALFKETDQQYREILENAPFPFLVVDWDGNYIDCNRAAADFAECSRDELLSRNVRHFIRRGQEERVLRSHRPFWKQGGVVETEFWIRGRCKILELMLAPVVWQGADAVVGLGKDLTDRRRLEMALERCRRRLEELASQRTERVENERRLRHERQLLLKLLDLHEKERRLVAYEIHDGFAQLAAAAAMQFLAFRQFDKHQPESGQKAFDQGIHLLEQSVREARRLINGLRPPILDDSGVVPAVEDLVNEVSEQAGFQVELAENLQSTRLAPLLETAIFRIVQESLTNARKYSRSERVRVQLQRDADVIRVEVQDWGVGFDPAQVQQTSFGLAGIRERARLLGGEARIETSPGQGTRVTVTLPLLPHAPSREENSDGE